MKNYALLFELEQDIGKRIVGGNRSKFGAKHVMWKHCKKRE